MKNKKGFTLIELIAVICILSILALVSFSSIFNTKSEVTEKQMKILRSTITSAFNNYRISHTIVKNQAIPIKNLEFSEPLSIDAHECNYTDDAIIYFVVKSDYNFYGDETGAVHPIENNTPESAFINNGICKTILVGDNIRCEVNENGYYKRSLQEVIVIKNFTCLDNNEDTNIDDIDYVNGIGE